MSSRFARLGASALLILGSGLLATITASSASADVPPTAVGEFEASPCAGETNLADPALTIAGTDLANYNAGSVVALYDSWGYPASADSFPPLCAVRYVSEAAGGPVGVRYAFVSACAEVADVPSGLAFNDGRPSLLRRHEWIVFRRDTDEVSKVVLLLEVGGEKSAGVATEGLVTVGFDVEHVVTVEGVH